MIDLSALKEARLQLHYALQPLAMATNLLPPQKESAQTALFWNDHDRTIHTKAIVGNTSVIILFDPQIFSLIVSTEEDMFQFDLKRKTLKEAMDWLKTILTELGVDTSELSPLPYPTFDFPYHPLALGSSFSCLDGKARNILIELFDQSNSALVELNRKYKNISEVRLWPHHFDLAVLLHYGKDATIGVGFSAGDQSYDRPYWYVSPYPKPEVLADLTIGQWHIQGWTGAVWLFTDTAQNSAHAIANFFHEGIRACQEAMGVEE
jgi:hypothetical protein